MSRSDLKFGAICIALILFTSAPIWGVQYFVNQDGSGHVHTAWMMLELLREDPRIAEMHQFNLMTFPNVGGHWLLALFLLFTSAFTATKLMMSITYVGFVAAVGWLRWNTGGRDGLLLSVVFAAAIGFNFLWLIGFYNFLLGLIITIFGVGLYFRWRERIAVWHAAVLSVLIVAAFLCHVVSFAVFGLALAAIAWLPVSQVSVRKLALTAAALIPVMPLIYLYRANTEAGGPMVPVWRHLGESIASPMAWIDQFRSVDSFVMLSRTAFPFTDVETPLFGVFAPILYIAAAILLLLLASLLRFRKEKGSLIAEGSIPFLAIAGVLLLFSVFAPDDIQFSSSEGGLLRERLFLAGLAFAVPLVRIEGLRPTFERVAIGLLAFVVVFQTVVLWEYAVRSDREAREFFAASQAIPEGASAAGVTIRPRGFRFSGSHIPSINNYNGIGRDIRLWDNYELGHNYFPIVTRSREDHEFIRKFTQNNAYALDRPEQMREERVEALRTLLTSEPRRIDTLVVWGSDPRVDAAVVAGFGEPPVYEQGNVRVFRR